MWGRSAIAGLLSLGCCASVVRAAELPPIDADRPVADRPTVEAAVSVDHRARRVRPPRVRLVDNGRDAGGAPKPAPVEPALRRVTDDALAAALHDLDARLDFADYPFSGCHDRAHLTWLALADALGEDAVAKVWLFGPRLLTVALDGAIEVAVDDARWGVDRTRWDYHVAAVVRTPTGLHLVDPTIGAIDRALPLHEWFAAMSIPPGAVWTLLPGSQYSFNTIGQAQWSGGRRPFNGATFRYDRVALAERWLEHNLARDDVASEVADARDACPALTAVLHEPRRLSETLAAMAGEPSPGCEPFVRRHAARLRHWTERIRAYAPADAVAGTDDASP